MTKKRFFTAFTATTLAGALALTALTACSGQGSTTSTLTPTNEAAGSLLLSVNPEIELEYDHQGNTLALAGINDDGAQVIPFSLKLKHFLLISVIIAQTLSLVLY